MGCAWCCLGFLRPPHSRCRLQAMEQDKEHQEMELKCTKEDYHNLLQEWQESFGEVCTCAAPALGAGTWGPGPAVPQRGAHPPWPPLGPLRWGGPAEYQGGWKIAPQGGGGGLGLFCRAITGADGLHGTNMGTNPPPKKGQFWNQRVEGGGSEKWSFAPFFDENKLRTIFAEKRPKSGPLAKEPLFRPPLPRGRGGSYDPSPAWGNYPPAQRSVQAEGRLVPLSSFRLLSPMYILPPRGGGGVCPGGTAHACDGGSPHASSRSGGVLCTKRYDPMRVSPTILHLNPRAISFLSSAPHPKAPPPPERRPTPMRCSGAGGLGCPLHKEKAHGTVLHVPQRCMCLRVMLL